MFRFQNGNSNKEIKVHFIARSILGKQEGFFQRSGANKNYYGGDQI